MKRLCLLIAGLILGVESRSLSQSSVEEQRLENRKPTLNQMDMAQEIFPEFETQGSSVYSTQLTPQPRKEVEKQNSIFPQDLKSSLVSQAQNLGRILVDLIGKNSVNGINDREELETQWLEQLQSTLKDISRENISLQSRKNAENFFSNHFTEFTTPESLQIFQQLNSLKDLFDSIQEIDVFYQDAQDDGEQVKSRYEDSSAQFSSDHEEARDAETESPETGATGSSENEGEENRENDADELDAMLVDLQSQVKRMRKYSKRLCRKRHSTAKAFEARQEPQASLIADSNDPKKLLILQ